MTIAEKYGKLFQPGTIGNMRLKNRLAMAPMGIGGLVENDGSMSQRAIDYYEERARGGVGLIITGLAFACTKFEPLWVEGRYFPFLRMDSPIVEGRLNRLVERVHDYDCKLCLQLTAGLGRVARVSTGQPIGASAIRHYWRPSTTLRALDTEEVEELVRSFGTAVPFSTGLLTSVTFFS